MIRIHFKKGLTGKTTYIDKMIKFGYNLTFDTCEKAKPRKPL